MQTNYIDISINTYCKDSVSETWAEVGLTKYDLLLPLITVMLCNKEDCDIGRTKRKVEVPVLQFLAE